MKKYILLLLMFGALLLVVPVNASANTGSSIAMNKGYAKGGGLYDVVIKDKKGVRIGLYVNDKNPTYAIGNNSNWATFKGVKLDGSSGKISFTTTWHDNGAAHEKPINYVRYYSINENKVGFTASNPTAVAPTPVQTPTPVPAPAPAPAPQPSCTSGTYVNSYGNTVCSPETSNSTPLGASAQCTDGTYSFSQHRSGTCSRHGGVAAWL